MCLFRFKKKQRIDPNVLETVQKVVEQLYGIIPGGVTEDKNIINDFNADSLDFIELIMKIEEVFHIEINDEEADQIETIYDLCQCIMEKKGS